MCKANVNNHNNDVTTRLVFFFSISDYYHVIFIFFSFLISIIHRKKRKREREQDTYTHGLCKTKAKKISFWKRTNCSIWKKNYYLIWLRAVALRLSRKCEWTRSFVANALIKDNSPANTVEQIICANLQEFSPGSVFGELPPMPSMLRHVCCAVNFVPPPIVPTSSEYIVHDMYKSRFSGPVASSQVKPTNERNLLLLFFFC